VALADKILSFYDNLVLPDLSEYDVEILAPFGELEPKAVMSDFFCRYYNDSQPRVMLIGINPGRFGGGTTGIPFTDPVNLERYCGISNDFPKRHELSSKFMYDMIEAYGGPAAFYSNYYFYSVSPVGFTKDGKNFNYYDDKKLKQALEPFIIDAFEKHLEMGMSTEIGYSLGQGKNLAVLNEINAKYKFFNEIKPLPHPRWVMQYRLKKKNLFIEQYIENLTPFKNDLFLK
jgi:hypothetical protein